MASIGTKLKKLPKKRKAYLFSIISFFVFILILGIDATFAYYHDSSSSLSILANLIGDFDAGDGDVNLMIYKETDMDSGLFTRSYSIPAIGYTLNNSLNSCTKPCDDDSSKSCKVTCGTDPSGSCYYTYDKATHLITLTSSHKLTCKFYFEQESESDINVYILKEEAGGTYSYNSKDYTLIESIPAYGYKYAGYTCDNPATVESFDYVSENKKFKVSTTTKNNCYAYFDEDGIADIVVNVFVQSGEGSSLYNKVESIPDNKTYIKSPVKTSACFDALGNTVSGATIEYTNGYIDITAAGQQTCDVYLDLTTN